MTQIPRSVPEMQLDGKDSRVRHEWAAMLMVLLIFAVFNIVTAPYSPDPWVDEVSYTDPAASLALEGKFASTLWGQQGVPLWIGNVPLHQLALAGFFKVFGFSCRVARSANVIYYTLATILICQIVRSNNLIQTRRGRWIFLLVLLGGTGLTAIFRNGRYDAIGMLLYFLWVFCSIHSLRHPLMLLGAGLAVALIPAAGLALAPLLLLSGLTALFLWRWQVVRLLAVSVVGGIGGIVIMEFAYRRLGIPNIFREVLKAGGSAAPLLDFSVATIKNPSYMAPLLAGGLGVLGLKRDCWREMRIRTALTLLMLGLVIPLFTEFVGKYQIYYCWVAIIPATLGAVMLLERQSLPRLAQIAGFLLILAATLPGFPRRCLAIAFAWQEDRPAIIQRYAQVNTSPTDVVFVRMDAFAVYYGLRNTVAMSYWNKPPESAAERKLVKMAFLAQTNGSAQLNQIFGGDWRQVDSHEFGARKWQVSSALPLHLTIYRRY
jgi:hypothetical protein